MATQQEILRAKQILEKYAPKGEFLAYINKEEALLLKQHGGSGEITKTGIPSFNTTTTRTLPPGYVESLGEDFTSYLDNTSGDLTNRDWYSDPTQYMGDSSNNWFTAGMDPMTALAQGLALDPSSGLGSYASYLQNASDFATDGQAFFNAQGTSYQPHMANATGQYSNAMQQAALQAAAAASGQNAGQGQLGLADAALANANTQFGDARGLYNRATGQYDLAAAAAAAGQNAGQPFFNQANQYSGANAYQQFMSPYQQQVIDATMAAYNQQQAEQSTALGASAGNAFGGSRFGVAEGQRAADAALGGAQLQGNLLAQGFTQANQLANQAYQQQMGLGQANMGQAAANQAAYNQAAQGYNQAGANLGQLGSQYQNQSQNQLQAGSAQQAMAAQNAALYGDAAQQYGLQGANQLAMAQSAQEQVQNQMGIYAGLGQQQMDLGDYGLTGLGNQLNTLTQMGQQNTALNQARLDNQQAALQAGQMANQQNLGFMSQMLGAAYGAPSSTTYATSPNPSTIQTLLGAGIGLGGILGAFRGNNNQNE